MLNSSPSCRSLGERLCLKAPAACACHSAGLASDPRCARARQVARFNLSHTMGDIRRFIRAARPDLPTAYSLLNATGFPPRPLSDDGATIEGAGIAGGMVTQKL